MKKVLLIISTLVLVLTLSACKNDGDDDQNVVYVTVYPMEYLVSEIGGDVVTVKRIPGSSTHGDYVEWTAKEIVSMKAADLLLYVHGGADDFVHNKAETFEGGNVELIDISTHIEYNLVCYSHNHDEDTTETVSDHSTEECDENALSEDPHFWLDPVRMLEAAEYIKDKLISTYPESSEVIENNYTTLNAALQQLHSDFQLMAESAVKPIMTTGTLFTYWHERYDIEILSISTDVHSTEIIPSDIIDYVHHAEEDGIMYILFEKNANSPAGEQVLKELQESVPDASALELHGLGNITPDEFDAGSTYLSIMYENLEVLKQATK